MLEVLEKGEWYRPRSSLGDHRWNARIPSHFVIFSKTGIDDV